MRSWLRNTTTKNNEYNLNEIFIAEKDESLIFVNQRKIASAMRKFYLKSREVLFTEKMCTRHKAGGPRACDAHINL